MLRYEAYARLIVQLRTRAPRQTQRVGAPKLYARGQSQKLRRGSVAEATQRVRAPNWAQNLHRGSMPKNLCRGSVPQNSMPGVGRRIYAEGRAQKLRRGSVPQTGRRIFTGGLCPKICAGAPNWAQNPKTLRQGSGAESTHDSGPFLHAPALQTGPWRPGARMEGA